MTREREYWDAALEAERQHGKHAPVYIAAQIGTAALDDDDEGIAFWKIVARCWTTLQEVKDENGDYPKPSSGS